MLELADREDPWPNSFDETFVVHGQPHSGEPLTLLDARVRQISMGRQTSKVRASMLALGAHVMPDRRWPAANYRPSTLHEWLPETGLSIEHPDDGDISHVVVGWRRPETRRIAVDGAVISIHPRADYNWSYAPGWKIETSMTFSVRADEPMTIAQHWERHGSPLLGFSVFAANQHDDLVYESYYDDRDETGIVLLRRGRRPANRDWRPNEGRFLFSAADLPDISSALAAWVELWHRTVPALGLFGETIEQGLTYSAPRFLTLYTAAEGYWSGTRRGKEQWNLRALAARAAVPPEITGATPEAISLAGATRRYHAHLGAGDKFSPKEMVNTTFESTRRLHALLQACLMREIGLETEDIERLMRAHYRSWPIP